MSWLRRALLIVLAVGLVGAAIVTAAYLEDRANYLTDSAIAAVEAGNLTKARREATTALELAPKQPRAWWYGGVVHHANLVLGMVALRSGDLEEAKKRLLDAGRTPGSPTLGSFGPNMRLALELLKAGQKEPVREYFRLCSAFWEMDRERRPGQLDRWTEDIESGRLPDFGANLLYGGWH